jgi:hypothetical protein
MIIKGWKAPLARSRVPHLREGEEIKSSSTDWAIDGGCVPPQPKILTTSEA